MNEAWPTQSWVNPTPADPRDSMNADEVLLLWKKKQEALATAKEEELEFRKYVVKREFPNANEGMNNKDLGNGYTLKAGVKFNYKLKDNATVEDCLNKLATLGNNGSFIAERLVSWTPNFLLTEYRQLVEDKEKGSKWAEEALKTIEPMLEISDAAPTLEIKEPKGKKK